MTTLVPVRTEGTVLRVAVAAMGEDNSPPLVVLHGLGASATTGLRPFAADPALAGCRRVLIDLPGFGASAAPAGWPGTIEADAEVVAAVIEALALRNVTLIGHSMGGSVGIVLATRRQDLVARLVVAEPLLDPGSGTLSAHITRQGEAGFVRRGFAALQLATRRQAARGDLAAVAFQQTLAQADPAVMHRGACSLRADRRPTFREQLLALPIPRLFLAGERSGIDASGLTAAGIAVALIPGAGHAMMDENPAGVARAIAAGFEISGASRCDL